MKQIPVGVIGATGYAGAELVRLLLSHTNVTLAALSSVSFEGKALCDVYPSFTGLLSGTLCNDETVIERSEVVFASLPHGLSETYARACADAGKIFIDLGADFRLESAAEALAQKPVLCIAGMLDIYTPPVLHCEPLTRAIESAGGTLLRTVSYPTDHFFADYRLTVAETVTTFLKEQLSE